MHWVGIGLVIVTIVGCVGFGVHHHLDAKAQKLSKGSEGMQKLRNSLKAARRSDV